MKTIKNKTKALSALTKLGAALMLLIALLFTACPNNAGGNKPKPTPTPPAVKKFKVTLENTVGGNVTVTPALPADGMVAEGTELNFTAAALTGYEVEKWELNGTAVNGTAATYKLTVKGNAAVKVFFKTNGTPITKHTVTLTVPVNGTVTAVPEIPSDNQVPEGSEITFTAVPNAGYTVDTWTVSPAEALQTGGTPGSDTAKVKITVDTTVTVTFKLKPPTSFTINFSVDGGHGTLKAKPEGGTETNVSPLTVEQGKTVLFTATPNDKFAVFKWTNGGSDIASAGNSAAYTHTVMANADIKVKFTYAGPGLGVSQQTLTGTVGETLSAYHFVISGSGSYTAVPENPGIITLDTSDLNSNGNITVTYDNVGSTRIKITDNLSGEEKYSGTITVSPLVTIPDDFIEGGIHYVVVDKTNKYVHIDYKTGGNFEANVHILATVAYDGETYAITGCTDNCLKSNFWQVEAFTVDGASAFLTADTGVLFDKNKTCLIKYPKNKTDSSYTVSDSVKTIGTYAFYEIRNNLTALSLPEGKSLTTIENYGISGCTELTSVNIPSTLNSLGKGFLFQAKITRAVIPEGVTWLGHGTLAWCPNLTHVELPASFKEALSGSILYNCGALTEVTCKAVNPPALGNGCFGNGTPIASCTLKVPNGSIAAYEAAPIWGNFKKPFVGF